MICTEDLDRRGGKPVQIAALNWQQTAPQSVAHFFLRTSRAKGSLFVVPNLRQILRRIRVGVRTPNIGSNYGDPFWRAHFAAHSVAPFVAHCVAHSVARSVERFVARLLFRAQLCVLSSMDVVSQFLVFRPESRSRVQTGASDENDVPRCCSANQNGIKEVTTPASSLKH